MQQPTLERDWRNPPKKSKSVRDPKGSPEPTNEVKRLIYCVAAIPITVILILVGYFGWAIFTNQY